MKAATTLMLLLFTTPLFLSQQPESVSTGHLEQGTIEGYVFAASNGEPLEGSQVLLTPLNVSAAPTPSAVDGTADPLEGFLGALVQSRNPPPPLIAPVTTGSDGRFVFRDLAPGKYRIVATANGYVRQEYGQHTIATDGEGIPISLEAGQSLKNLTIRMTRVAVVSGRILDDTGSPAVSAPVQLLQFTYGSYGRTIRVAGSTTVDDRGEYRMFSLAPGRYFLTAGNRPGPPHPSVADGPAATLIPVSSVSRSGVSYAATYYPSAPDIASATILEVQPDAELRADMTLKRQGSYTVSSRLIDSRTGQPPADAAILLAYRSFSRNFTGGGSFPAVPGYNPATGIIEIQNVIPGEWFIQAKSQSVGQVSAGQSIQGSRAPVLLSALVPILVPSADVGGLAITLTPGTPIEGRVVTENGLELSQLPPKQTQVRLHQSTNGIVDASAFAGGPPFQSVAADGSFRFENVRQGEYVVEFFPASPAYYVKSIRMGNEDVQNKPLVISGPVSDVLQITLRGGGGHISGTVIDASSAPVANVQAVLIPEPSLRNRRDLFRTAVTDQKGQFAFEAIPPGNYKIFSWEALEPSAYFDPDVMVQYEDQGRAVRVDESLAMTVDVKRIPEMGK